MSPLCEGCPRGIGSIFQTCFENNEASIAFLRSHGVLPTSVQCPTCKRDCIFREDKHLWRCTNSYVIPKTKKRRLCNYTISDYHGTFLERVRLQPWQIVIFVYYWVQKIFTHYTVLRNVQITLETSVDSSGDAYKRTVSECVVVTRLAQVKTGKRTRTHHRSPPGRTLYSSSPHSTTRPPTELYEEST